MLPVLFVWLVIFCSKLFLQKTFYKNFLKGNCNWVLFVCMYGWRRRRAAWDPHWTWRPIFDRDLISRLVTCGSLHWIGDLCSYFLHVPWPALNCCFEEVKYSVVRVSLYSGFGKSVVKWAVARRFQAGFVWNLTWLKTLALALTVVGCYRPPSATNESLLSLTDSLSKLNFKEIVLIGDLNRNWLQSL